VLDIGARLLYALKHWLAVVPMISLCDNDERSGLTIRRDDFQLPFSAICK